MTAGFTQHLRRVRDVGPMLQPATLLTQHLVSHARAACRTSPSPTIGTLTQYSSCTLKRVAATSTWYFAGEMWLSCAETVTFNSVAAINSDNFDFDDVECSRLRRNSNRFCSCLQNLWTHDYQSTQAMVQAAKQKSRERSIPLQCPGFK